MSHDDQWLTRAAREMEVRARAEAAIDAADGALADLALRRQQREAAGIPDDDWSAPAAPTVHRAQRSAAASSMTPAEVSAICRAIVDGERLNMAEAVGEVVGEIRSEFRLEIAALRAQIDKNAEPAVLQQILQGLGRLDDRLAELAKHDVQGLSSLEVDEVRH